jgi:RNA polymerase sigma-70 factor (ECF subfamily)
MHRTDDRQLVGRLLDGDERAFQAFFDEYFGRLYRFALSRTSGNADLSQEAAQRALCRAVRALDSWRGDASLFTWLAQICRNELADLLEASNRDAARNDRIDASDRSRARAEAVPDDAPAPPDAAQRRDASLLIREVLDSLPGRYGEVLEWKYLEDWPVDRIARELETTFEAAQSTLARARLAFRSALAARGLELDELLP